MTGFGDAPPVGSGSELQLTIDGRAVAHADVVAAAEARAGDGVEEENPFAVGALLAARAATPATRRQYASI